MRFDIMHAPNFYPGHLFLIAAASGTGKTSLVKALLEQDSALQLSVSATTRSPRPNEIAGQDYHFLSTEHFHMMLEKKAFLEHAHVHGNWYGTPCEPVYEALKAGVDIILEIDWQGAEQVRNLFPHVVDIFILPPSIDTLKQRLQNRAQDSQETIELRVHNAKEELQHANAFQYVIINEDFQKALLDLRAIIQAARLEFHTQTYKNSKLFNSLNILF